MPAIPAFPLRRRLPLLLLLHFPLALWMKNGWVAGTAAAAMMPGSSPLPESALQKPTVFLAILARNAARSLPHFLGCLERLRYPKNRIAVWVATDHNIDNTTAMLREWLKNVQKLYHYVEWRPMDEP
ncbi:procollagen galactosyltransferase 2-like, partial [Thamnophis elegans]|uniref:procollagen galactosyltransferase 2-like n=1 Tax=Thamnophis elegans TaxID=35005 RepID=UPI0013786B51